MLSPFLVFSSKNPLSSTPSPCSPTHPFPFLALAFPYTGASNPHRTRASPPIDDRLGHPLLDMQLEPWFPPCVFFGWRFSPRELWGYWLVHIVPSMGLQTASAPWILSLAPSLGTLCSIQWMAVSIHFCICPHFIFISDLCCTCRLFDLLSLSSPRIIQSYSNAYLLYFSFLIFEGSISKVLT